MSEAAAVTLAAKRRPNRAADARRPCAFRLTILKNTKIVQHFCSLFFYTIRPPAFFARPHPASASAPPRRLAQTVRLWHTTLVPFQTPPDRREMFDILSFIHPHRRADRVHDRGQRRADGRLRRVSGHGDHPRHRPFGDHGRLPCPAPEALAARAASAMAVPGRRDRRADDGVQQPVLRPHQPVGHRGARPAGPGGRVAAD